LFFLPSGLFKGTKEPWSYWSFGIAFVLPEGSRQGDPAPCLKIKNEAGNRAVVQ
jgi:hypothetical protein